MVSLEDVVVVDVEERNREELLSAGKEIRGCR
jgi:hypothetical protein